MPRKKATTKKKVQNKTPKDENTSRDGEIILAKWQGRFGNRMHQYAYLATYAEKFNLNLILPSEWEGDHLFKKNNHTIIKDDDLRLKVNQTSKEFDKQEFREQAFQDYNKKSKNNLIFLNPHDASQTWKGSRFVWVADLCAYQEAIFKGMSNSFLKEVFTFSDNIKNTDVYKYAEDRQGTYDIAHLRRDDISNPNYENNFGYSVISKKSYEKAFKKFDVDSEKVEWTTDDWSGNWGVGKPSDNKWFKRRGGWTYPMGSEHMEDVVFDWFPDFLRLYFARSVFRANSSFGFWACLLGNQKNIFSPVLTKKEIYSGTKGSGKQIEVNFIKGNTPHWLCLKEDHCGKIKIPK